jgi:anti-anti-sigma factor
MTDQPFRVEVHEKEARLEARFFGELTIDAEQALDSAFHGADLTARPAVVIDFASVPYVNSAGIAALLGTLINLRERTSGIRFVGLNRHLEKIFRMTGFPSLVSM